MTEKRFKSNCKLGLVNGEEPLCKCLLDNGKPKSYREWVDLLNNLIDENEQFKKENEQLKKTNDLLSDFRGYIDIKQQEKELPTDKNGYNKIICPICASDLKYSRFIGYMNGEQYEEFDCTQCDFYGRIRKGNLYDDLYE